MDRWVCTYNPKATYICKYNPKILNTRICVSFMLHTHARTPAHTHAHTPVEGPSAQDRYCARGLGGGAKKRRANEKEQK